MPAAPPDRYLLDTTVLVAYVRGQDLGMWIEHRYRLTTARTVPLVSVVTHGEMRSRALQRGWGDGRVRRLEELLRRFVLVPLELPGVIPAYAEIDCHLRRNGISLGKNDIWIAATAKATGAKLVTTDRDFDPLDPGFLRHDWIDPSCGWQHATP